MIEFTRRPDSAAVRSILTEPQSYRRMVNDTAPEREAFTLGCPHGYDAILAAESGKSVAVFLLFRKDARTAEVHFCFRPSAWGRSGYIAAEFLRWVWETTTWQRLIGPIPSYNRLCLKLATAVGFRPFRVARDVGTKHGQPFDLILTDITRPSA
jgi:RimJ/RimL family protein N-acetyltransferase